MSGEEDLSKILANLRPRLDEGDYVFVTRSQARYGDHAEWNPVATVVEDEGVTFVIRQSTADASGLSYESSFRRITLELHSSLEAVGLTAAVSAILAEHGISANMIAGFYHDHIFVPAHAADQAVQLLS